MIVRIMGEGQVNVADSHLAELNRLDDELLAEMQSGDSPGFRRTLHALLERIRELGEPLPDDSLEPSELILPAPDATLEDVRKLLRDDGLIPG
ncbi:PspA-associated protein PspAA [Streptomyces sp. NBC_00467]|uniref:PspA-associated protein PspAA n=1 Tax=Streptomyces sp. NBC_00467 TaxID=2975752 RepID=UPI002E19C919